MSSDPKNSLTTPVPSGSGTGGELDAMVGDENRKEWSRRYSWASCREPFKTELDTLASHWIEGHLSNESLALELWQLRDKLQFSEAPSRTLSGVPLFDVQSDLDTIVRAMLGATLYPSTTQEERHALLDHSRSVRSTNAENSR